MSGGSGVSGGWDDDTRVSPAPYPGWMPDDEGRAYSEQVGTDFRTAMSALAATVCVVAAASPTAGRTGITATAVCSLSTEPPQLVACVNRSSSIARLLNDTGWFTVNVLAAHQEDVAGTFAGRGGLVGEQRFDGAAWSTHVTGTPVLHGATATFVCHASASLQQATHLIVVGAVLDVLLGAPEPPAPLMYHLRRFTAVQPLPVEAHRSPARPTAQETP